MDRAIAVATTIDTLHDALELAVSGSRNEHRIALVPTMGALHAGHLSLVRRAARIADVVVVSIFVNPLQFGPTEDLERYPRTLEADLATLSGEADLVFAPSVTQMYPDGPTATRVSAGAVGALYEGVTRPGHFDGMLTVVAKLINIVGPQVTVFGQKDAQQIFLVRQMVRDLNLPTALEVVPTVREADGLALSSRNRYLNAGEHDAALVLSAALAAASDAAVDGTDAALSISRARVASRPAVKLDYLVVVDPETFLPVADDYRGQATMLIAARVGSTHLIDNASLVIGS
nr:pantoate--beta-alanine ligase [Glaciibacter superstes]